MDALYIFVEGDDDERFFREILFPRLKEKYSNIKIVKYARKSKKSEYIKRFIQSILSMKGNYIYVTDINDSPCVTAKKQEIKNRIRNIDGNKILVVIKEIESWYMAGIDRNSAKNLGIKDKDFRTIERTTETITKEQFNSLIPKKFSSRIDFMREILKKFSINIAKNKTRSLKYCIEKYDC